MKKDWKDLDSKTIFRKKNRAPGIAKKAGYECLSHFIHDLYYGQEKTITEVSKIASLHRQSLENYMRTWGFEQRKVETSPVSQEEKEKILALKKTHSAIKAAAACGRSVTTVYAVWRGSKPEKKPVQPIESSEQKQAGVRFFGLSTWKSRGISKETAAINHRTLEYMAWKKRQNETCTPLPEKTMRIGEYANF